MGGVQLPVGGGGGLVHWLVLKPVQVALQVSVPELKPLVAQVWLLRLAPSQGSLGSRVPLPQADGGGATGFNQVKVMFWKLSVLENVVLYLRVEPLKQGEEVRV